MNRYKLAYFGPSIDASSGEWSEQCISLEFNAGSDEEAIARRDSLKEKGVRVGPLFRIETKEVLVRT